MGTSTLAMSFRKPRSGRNRLQQNAPYETVRVAKRVYVGNLSWQVSWQDLKDHFREAGEVIYADVMTEGGKGGGRSKGCGIVEFEKPSEAKWAIENLNDTEISGRPIFIREDREDYDLQDDGGARGGGGGYGGGGYGGGGSKGKGKGGGKGGGGSKLYVGNLSWDTSWQDLKDTFAEIGAVNFTEVIEKDGRSQGWGLVEMASAKDARVAIQQLDGCEIDGREIEVREDNKDGGGGGFSGGGGGGGGGYQGGGANQGCRVYVGNLDWGVSWQDLKDHFRSVGEASFAEVMTEGGQRGGRSKGCGIVEFSTAAEAQNAIQQLNDSELNGREIFVREDRE